MMNQVFWTNRSEEWYTKRLASISTGGASGKPLGVKHWRDQLRGHKDMRKVIVQHEAWSQEELERYITPVQ